MRAFAPAQLRAIIAAQLAPLPPDRTVALVATVDRRGVPVLAEFQSKDGQWRVEAAYRFNFDRTQEIRAAVLFAW